MGGNQTLNLVELFARFERILESFDKLSKGKNLETENARRHISIIGEYLAEMSNRLTVLSCKEYIKTKDDFKLKNKIFPYK